MRKNRDGITGSRHNQGGARADLAKIELKVGFFKTRLLEFRGRRDGKLGLPRPDTDGLWISPFIAKEQHHAETYKTQKWAEHELAVAAAQEEAGRLNHEIADIKAAIAARLKTEPSPPAEQELSMVLKQEHGAEPGVIRARRRREWEKRNAGYYSAIRSLESKVNGLKNRRAELLASVEESECVTRLLCEKKRDLHRQRVDIYYHGVLLKHPDRKTMPPVPLFVWENFGETVYQNQHCKTKTEVTEYVAI